MRTDTECSLAVSHCYSSTVHTLTPSVSHDSDIYTECSLSQSQWSELLIYQTPSTSIKLCLI